MILLPDNSDGQVDARDVNGYHNLNSVDFETFCLSVGRSVSAGAELPAWESVAVDDLTLCIYRWWRVLSLFVAGRQRMNLYMNTGLTPVGSSAFAIDSLYSAIYQMRWRCS